MPGVEPGFFPLDRQLELWEKNWSEGLAKEAVWLSGALDSFERAEEALARVGHVCMSDSTLWRRMDKWGARFEQLEQERQAAANRVAQRGEVSASSGKSAARMGGSGWGQDPYSAGRVERVESGLFV